MTILKGTQGIRAYQLASYYGHLWATTAYKMVKEALGDGFEDEHDIYDYIAEPGLELEELRKRSEIADEMSPVKGIWEPMLDESGNIVHTTTTGRLEWVIEPDGSVHFSLYRPNDVQPAIVAHCTPLLDLTVHVLSSYTYLRHFRALAEALWAIGIPMEKIEKEMPEILRDPEKDLKMELEELEDAIPSPRKLFVDRGFEARELVFVPTEYGWEIK